MTDEEPGLLGNLPRSRPGTRSQKRTQGTGSKPAPKRSQAAKPGVKSTAAKKPAAKKPAARKKPPAPRSEPAPAREEPLAPPPSQPTAAGPLGSAVKVAGAGLRVAEGVTREVLRRLPRP